MGKSRLETVFFGGEAGLFFEKPGEMLGVLESEAFGNLLSG